MTVHTIRTSHPREMLAAIAYQLGFQPTDSVVVASWAGRGLAHGATIVGRARRAVTAAAGAPARWSHGRQNPVDRFEAWTTRRRTGGAMAALVAVVLLLALALPGQ